MWIIIRTDILVHISNFNLLGIRLWYCCCDVVVAVLLSLYLYVLKPNYMLHNLVLFHWMSI